MKPEIESYPLTKKACKLIEKLAYELYCTKGCGMQSIIDLGEAMKLPYMFCEDCDTELPVLWDVKYGWSCLMCGSGRVKDIEDSE